MTNLSLPPAGVAMLIFQSTRRDPAGLLSIPNPDEGKPGIRSTAYQGRSDVVLIEALGYETNAEAHTAIARAAQKCLDAGFNVSFAPPGCTRPSRLVSRRVP